MFQTSRLSQVGGSVLGSPCFKIALTFQQSNGVGGMLEKSILITFNTDKAALSLLLVSSWLFKLEEIRC